MLLDWIMFCNYYIWATPLPLKQKDNIQHTKSTFFSKLTVVPHEVMKLLEPIPATEGWRWSSIKSYWRNPKHAWGKQTPLGLMQTMTHTDINSFSWQTININLSDIIYCFTSSYQRSRIFIKILLFCSGLIFLLKMFNKKPS